MPMKILIFLLLLHVNFAMADWNRGVKAYERGDYLIAYLELKELAEQGDAYAQGVLGSLYAEGKGVPKDYVKAYMWFNLSAAQGYEDAKKRRDKLLTRMTPIQIAAAQRLFTAFRKGKGFAGSYGAELETKPKLAGSGSGIIVGKNYVITNRHVGDGCSNIFVYIGGKPVSGNLFVSSDTDDLAVIRLAAPATDLASFRSSGRVRLAETILVAGYPLRGLLADNMNIVSGEVSSLAGPGNQARYLQISAPVQPGNSGGPVLDNAGNVIGMVVAKLNAITVAGMTGDIPQNVNFAIKGAVVKSFLDIHGIDYETSTAHGNKTHVEIAEAAKNFTVPVECYK